MIEYIKILIIAIFTGVFAALPASSSAHVSFLNSVIDFTDNEKLLPFYYSVFMLVFCVVIFINLRKIYIKAFTSVFKKSEDRTVIAYKKRQKDIILSVLPCLILFVPVSSEMLLCDYFDKLLAGSNFLVASIAGVVCGLFMLIALWYTKSNKGNTVRNTPTKSVLRMSVYNLVSMIIPGVSKVSLSASNLLISDVEPKVMMREIYLYLAPQVFVFNLIKVVITLKNGIAFNPYVLLLGMLVTAFASALIISLAGKVNMRKLMAFFSIYSIIFAVFVGLISSIV